MAPYSPAIGLSLVHESQAPPPPKLSTKLLSSLLSPQTEVLPLAKDGVIPMMKPRKLDYSPHISNTHGRRCEESSRKSWPGMSTVILSVLLVMLIGLSSSQLQYEQIGREQSMLDVVKDAYFDQGVKINARDYTKVYLVNGPILDMEIKMEKREDDAPPPSSAMPPVDTPSATLITSSATSSSSSAKPTPTGAKANFRNPDDVRDPSAVKPSDDMESQPPPDDTQPTDMPAKRHWGSRHRGSSFGARPA